MEKLEQVLCDHCNKPVTDNPLVVLSVRSKKRNATEIDEFTQFFHQSAMECANAMSKREHELHNVRLTGVRVG